MNNVKVIVRGYGQLPLARTMQLTDGVKSIGFRTRRKIILGIRHHALQELNTSSQITTYVQPSFPFAVLSKKMLSLGIVSGRLFKGIFNGFQCEIEFSSEFFADAPWIVQEPGIIPHVIRSVGRSGILLHEYRPILEYSIRRKQVTSDIIIVSAYVLPTSSDVRTFGEEITKLENHSTVEEAIKFINLLPKWHGLRTHFSLLHNDPESFQSKNVFYPEFPSIGVDERNVDVKYSQSGLGITTSSRKRTLNPIFFIAQMNNVTLLNGCNITKGKHLIFTDTSENMLQKKSAMWPLLNWSISGSDLIAVPPFTREPSSIPNGWYLPSNTNWAHFLEDVAPRVLLMGTSERSGSSLLSKVVDPVQSELLEKLGVSHQVEVDDRSNFNIESFTFFIHKNQRNLIINGASGTSDLSADVELMRILRQRINESFTIEPREASKIFVIRNSGLLRKLINQAEVVNYLESINYRVVSMDNLSLKHRVEILSSCDSLVYESGAAGTNSFLTKDGTEIVELRHPSNVSSQEHNGMVKTIQADWKVVLGKRASFIHRLFHGSDSWILKIDKLKKTLSDD